MSQARPRETVLSQELRKTQPRKRVTPRDAFELALDKWLNNERIEIGALAEELGVARATVFRWVGSRDLMLGEIIWHIFQSTWKSALSRAKGKGADYAAEFTYYLMTEVLEHAPFRRFIEQDPEYALRILTSKSSPMQARVIDAVTQLLRERAAAGEIVPALKIEDLAYIIVRIVESCLYSDQITGRQPNLAVARDAIRILVDARPAAAPSAKRKARRPVAVARRGR